MCGPPALALAAAAVTMVGQGVGALQSAAQHRYEAKIADRNAKMENEAAGREIQNTRDAALAHYRKLAQLKGDQRVAAAANGVALDFGTAADLADNTDMLGREDVKRIYDQGNQNVRGFEINASNYMGEKNAQKSAASGALVKGAFDMASTALSAASQYKTLKAGRSG